MTRAQVRTALVVGLGTASAPFDTAVNIAFPDITAAFRLSLPDIQWVVVCYVLTYASLMLGFGRLGDIFGHRRVFAAGLVCNAVGLALCAAAPSFGWFLAFRVVQGIGAALTLACGPALMTLGFPEAQRGRMLAAYTMMFGLAAAAGPLIGGVLVDHGGWPAVFWFRIPIVLAGLLFLRGLGSTPLPTDRQRVDLFGTALIAASLSALLLAPNRAGDAALFLGLAVIGFAVFVWHERRTAAPVIDLSLFRRGGFVFVNISGILVQMAGFAVWMLTPYFLLQVQTFSAGVGGLLLALSPLGMAVGGDLGGRAMRRLTTGRVAAAGAVLMAVALLAMSGWSAGTGLIALIATLFLHGFGQGLFQVATLDIVVETVPRAQRGVAGSLAMVTRTLGFVSGATVSTLLFELMERQALATGADRLVAFLASHQTVFVWAGVIAGVCGAGLWFLGRRQARPVD